ncbi:MAG: hypothetical protein M3Y91_10960 [Actinomycetota bacterium]|nr:hypothetical protein [Actinomycetota bacterium]
MLAMRAATAARSAAEGSILSPPGHVYDVTTGLITTILPAPIHTNPPDPTSTTTEEPLMCDEPADRRLVLAAIPTTATGPAVDPIAL